MAQLAIKGHTTRGKDVIEILEMLGGINSTNLSGKNNDVMYIISSSYNGEIIYMPYRTDSYVVFTLEEFLEKFPYKVWDKVQYKGATSCGSIFEVEKMRWEENTVKYTLRLFGCNYKSSTLPAAHLQPYKEETMEEIDEKAVNHVFDTEVISFDIAQRDKYELDLQGKFHVVLREGKWYVERIQPQYPKTYEECCEIVGIKYPVVGGLPDGLGASTYRITEIRPLIYILICRDAYWKIAGDWKPNLEEDNGGYRYCIRNQSNKIVLSNEWLGENYILSFQTAEMRDAFYENFKELIEACKELL